tara:strand:- start:227 stop:631 length:405 start_codon:yes stop_codon:yes gene_type:complete
LALSRADFLLHVYGDNLGDRGNFTAFFRAKGDIDRIKSLYLRGKKYYSYSQPRANFFGSFGKRFIVDENEYEKRKQAGVNSFLKGDSSLGKREKKYRKVCKNMIKFGLLTRGNCEKMDLPQSTFSDMRDETEQD